MCQLDILRCFASFHTYRGMPVLRLDKSHFTASIDVTDHGVDMKYTVKATLMNINHVPAELPLCLR